MMEQIYSFTQSMISVVAMFCIIVISISVIMLMYRAITGPTNPDRAVALDSIGINLMALAGLMAILLVTTQLNDVVLLIGILLFIGTVAIAKFLEKGVIIERDID